MKQVDSLTENFLVRVPTLHDLETVFKLMHIALQHDTYEKELRAGKELSMQSLTG